MQKREKILITGVSGFVGYHFLQYLSGVNKPIEVYGVDMVPPKYDFKNFSKNIEFSFVKINLLDIEDLENLFKIFVPDYILHLASYSSVAYSWKNPRESFKNNTNIFLNLVMATMECNMNCRILSVGSSEEYGNVGEKDLPLKENRKLEPTSPYAVARVSQEMLAQIFSKDYGLDIIMTRSFNHIGPYQNIKFVIPGFIDRMVKIKKSGKKKGIIETGNIEIVRDFVDVRDVVDAYYRLLHKGTAGEIYNVCTGKGYTLKSIIQMLEQKFDLIVETKVNSEYVRPNDNLRIIGDYSKIKNQLGWEAKIDINTTLDDMISTLEDKIC